MPETEIHKLGQLVRDARTMRGMTQDDLATALRLNDRTLISQLERGRSKKPIDPDIINRLARVLRVPVVEMLAAMGYDLQFEGIEDEQEVTLLRLYRAVPPLYQRASLRGLQELVREIEGEAG